jgi:hypothetical protein
MTLESKVRFLVLSHYLLGVLQFLLGWVGFYLIDIGWPMITNPEAYTDGSPRMFSPDFEGLVWVVFGFVLILGGWIHSVLTFISGAFIERRIYHGFSLTMAGANSTMIPVGPVICYYCFALLNNPQIKSEYRAKIPNKQAVPSK